MNTIALPEYQSHKKVRAARIIEVALDNVEKPEWGTLTLEAPGMPLMTHRVPAGWINRTRAEIGMYYVRYENGYESVSPAAVFEDGYSRIVAGKPVPVDQIAPLAGRIWNQPLASSATPQAQVAVDPLGHARGCPQRWNDQETCTCGGKK